MTQKPHLGLDPSDWPSFRETAHKMLDAALDQMQHGADGPVWRPLPEQMKSLFSADLPRAGKPVAETMAALLPYGVGNTHPRFFGWVHGSGTPAGIMADMAAAAMNANLGGRDHGAIYVEQQVVAWCLEMFGMPKTGSGIVVSGTSMATLIALKTARDAATGFAARKDGPTPGMVAYTSAQTHSCVARACDILGLGSDSLRKIATNARGEILTDALAPAIAADRAAGLTPFAIIGTAGSVNTGAIDDLSTLADIAQAEGLWLHVDGAFGAAAILAPSIAPQLAAISRAASVAFDFHKWLHVNYDAGMVLIRDEAAHRHAFAERPDYLKHAPRGLAAGDRWPTDYGPELSRGFRALKIWAQLAEFGTDRLGALIEMNCAQARYLETLVTANPKLELMSPVTLNICCFRYGADRPDADALNDEIVMQLHESGVAAPSTTTVNGHSCIRVNITNHRTQMSDLDLLVAEVCRIGDAL